MASVQPSLRKCGYAQGMLRSFVFTSILIVSACTGDIYVRDGVTDGDTFYLAPQASMNDDPILQSWVSYSLTRSACQLDMGGTNPARASYYHCELTARKHLLATWSEQQLEYPGVRDQYLDTLVRVREAGLLDEYVVYYFGTNDWQVPAEVNTSDFRRWKKSELNGHRPVTRITGSWNYADKVSAALEQE